MRKCSICHIGKPEEDFYWNSRHKKKCARCKDCSRAYINRMSKTPAWKYYYLTRRFSETDITLHEYVELLKLPCVYCGRFFSESGSSLDRIDNAIGYMKANVVTCCSFCNGVRNNVFTYEEMLYELAPAIRRILKERPTAFDIGGAAALTRRNKVLPSS